MKPLRVLVVEDDAIIGMLLAEMLELMGHEVCALVRAEAHAVVAAIRCKPDMMIVDMWLREGNGVAAVERICAASPVPHLFVSGDIARARALRPDAIMIQKPFREADLARGIQRALEAATS
jgi:two-component system, response regulator PdtaR